MEGVTDEDGKTELEELGDDPNDMLTLGDGVRVAATDTLTLGEGVVDLDGVRLALTDMLNDREALALSVGEGVVEGVALELGVSLLVTDAESDGDSDALQRSTLTKWHSDEESAGMRVQDIRGRTAHRHSRLRRRPRCNCSRRHCARRRGRDLQDSKHRQVKMVAE